MNKRLIKILFFWILPLLLVFSACNKDGLKVVATQGTPGNLTASATSLSYTEADSASNAVSFNWTSADFGYSAAVSYYLEFSYNDSDFSRVFSISTGTTLSQNFSVEDFNNTVLGAKYPAGAFDTVYVRAKAQIGDSNYVYSNVIQVTVTPYLTKRVIGYSFLYVPGAYQGWDFGTTSAYVPSIIAKVYSPLGNGVYDGYVNIDNASDNIFKFANQAGWTGIGYGTADGNVDGGGLSTDPNAGNLTVDGAGYYLLHADVPNLKWTATLQNWSLIGDFNGWAADLPFDFDDSDQVLVKTLQLPVGGLKFRANGTWDVQLGDQDDGSGNGTGLPLNAATGEATLSNGGDNIPITQAGTYKITLDLRVPSEPYCTVIKQ